MNKNSHFDGLWLWDLTRSPANIRRYIRLMDKTLRLMRQTPGNDHECSAFLSYLQLGGVMPQGKRFLSRVLHQLIPWHPDVAARLISIEILKFGTKRFSTETIVGWLDSWAEHPYSGGLAQIPSVLDSLRRKDIQIPKEKVICYCKLLAERFLYREMGNALLDYRLDLDPLITDRETYDWALRSAEMNDHGIARTWVIFLRRATDKKALPNRAWIKGMATILHTAYTSNRADRESIIEFMLCCAHSHLRYRSYNSLLCQYRRMLAVTHREMKQALENDMTVGSLPPRDYRKK